MTYPVNHDYFSEWSNNMAYIQGFTMSDGCIDDNNGHNILCYNISNKDRAVLEFIRKELSPNRPFYENSKKELVYLSITSKKIVQDLAIYNIIPRKTGKERLPDIPNEFKSAYLLGLFDGDGNIYCKEHIRKSGKRFGTIRKDFEYRIFCLSEDFLNEVNKELCFNYGTIRWNGSCFVLSITKKENIDKIYKFMYSHNPEFFLKRKRVIFDDIPKPIYYEAFNESKTIKDWLKDDRCIIKNKKLILDRIRLSKTFSNFESCITIKSKRNK